jgi:hypothetical protein
MLEWFMGAEARFRYLAAKASRYDGKAEEAFIEWNKTELFCPNCEVGMYRYACVNDLFTKDFGKPIEDQPGYEQVNCPCCKHISIWMFGPPAPLLMRHYNPLSEQQLKLVTDAREQVKAILGELELPADRVSRIADRITDAIVKMETLTPAEVKANLTHR